jgi:hypothetical protein
MQRLGAALPGVIQRYENISCPFKTMGCFALYFLQEPDAVALVAFRAVVVQ